MYLVAFHNIPKRRKNKSCKASNLPVDNVKIHPVVNLLENQLSKLPNWNNRISAFIYLKAAIAYFSLFSVQHRFSSY
jgi:hypothetical protein